ncbi:hypothetical protein MRX96_040672 [Rhipicephalus microplus]
MGRSSFKETQEGPPYNSVQLVRVAMAHRYDDRLHPVEWAILEANRPLTEEAQKPSLYLQAFLDMVQFTITVVTCCAKDERETQGPPLLCCNSASITC